MKKLLLGLVALSSLSAFANSKCEVIARSGNVASELPQFYWTLF